MIRRLLYVLLVLLLLPLLLASWLVASESGLRWAFDTARPYAPGEIEVGRLSGRLLGPIHVEQLHYRDATAELDAGRVALRWDLWALLSGRLEVEGLDIDTLALRLAAATKAETAPPATPPAVGLPLRVNLRRLAIAGIEIEQGTTRVALDRIELAADWSRQGIALERVEIDAGDHLARIAGSIDPLQDYAHELALEWQTRLRTTETLRGRGSLRGDLAQTRLEQTLDGAVALELTLGLERPLSAPAWRLEAAADAFELARLDPQLPPLAGGLRIAASGDLASLAANGEFRIERGAPVPVAARFELGEARFGADYTTLDIAALRVISEDGEVSADGRLTLAPALEWQAKLRLRDVNPERYAADWPGRLAAELTTSGRIDDGRPALQLDVTDLRGELRGYPVALESRVAYRDDRLEIAALDLESGATGANLAGTLGERLDLRWTLDSPNLAELYPGAGGSLVAGGTLAGARATPTIEASFVGTGLRLGEYAIAQLDGRAKLALPAEVGVDTVAQNLDLKFVANGLQLQTVALTRLEIAADNRRIDSRVASDAGNARLEFSGGLDGLAWRGRLVAAEIDTAAYGLWKLRDSAAVELGAERVSVDRACLAQLEGASLCAALAGAGTDWRADIGLERFALRYLRPLLPPELELEGLVATTARLRLGAPARLRGEIEIALAPGVIIYPVVAGQRQSLDYAGGEIRVTLADAGIEARAVLGLRADDRLAAQLRLPAAEALALAPQTQPLEAEARLNLNDLALVEVWLAEVDALRGHAELDVGLGGTLAAPRIRGAARLEAVAFTLPRLGFDVERIDAVARSDGLETIEYRLDARVAGGTLTADGSTRVDADAGWPSQVRLNGSRIELGRLLGPWLPPNFELAGLLDLSARLDGQWPDRLHGSIRVGAGQGSLAYPLPDGEPGRWAFHDAGLVLTLDTGGINGHGEIVIGENSLFAQLDLPGARALAMQPDGQALAAKLAIDLRDLSLLESLLPDIQRPSGHLEVSVDATGTLAQPRFSGRADLRDGAVRVTRLGLDLQQVTLAAATDDANLLRFSGGARSGDGNLSISGDSELDAARGWPSRIQIEGSNFLVARIPEATITISPKLVVSVREQTIDVQGDLLIPRAKLQPRDVTTAATVSEDTVIIGGERPPERKWQITARTNLILGERVTFFGFGFEGRLGGNLLITEQPGQPTRGTGIVHVYDGRYRAYGQRLDIESGRLLFAGGPLTNPGLDIRAVREAGDVTAGLRVTGRLRQPQLDLFSSPAMGQTDTLSYLLTGGPLETATGEEGAMMANAALALGLSGGDRIARSLGDRFGFDDLRVESSDTGEQASLVVGRYLSPRLYVSYGVGLVESINTLNLRYRITDRWRLEAEQGADQGADLLFSIER